LPVELHYGFEIETLPAGEVALAIETPARFAMTLNGRPIAKDQDQGWWVDPCLRRIPLDTALLRKGSNRIVLAIDFTEADGLEAMFLLGHFGVRAEGTRLTMTAPPAVLAAGDWTAQGLPFYSGAVAYRWTANVKRERGERVFVSLPEFKGTVARVLVDGVEAGFLPWPPYELDITACLTGERADIAIEVIASRRNSFGPLHQKNIQPWVGPDSFLTGGDDWSDDYVVRPCGLLEPPRLVWRR
jgi:hypothetical protein